MNVSIEQMHGPCLGKPTLRTQQYEESVEEMRKQLVRYDKNQEDEGIFGSPVEKLF